MYQRQPWRAAQNEMPRQEIFFEKTMTASSLPPHSRLVIPSQFVKKHADKVHQSVTVTLRKAESDKSWEVKARVLFPKNRPQTILHHGWKTFATAHDLAVGDRLTFVFVSSGVSSGVSRSFFDVFILRKGASLSGENPIICCSQKPMSVRRVSNPETKLSQPISADKFEGSELARTGTGTAPFTEETTRETVKAETYVADVAPEAPYSSQNPYGMDLHAFEQEVPCGLFEDAPFWTGELDEGNASLNLTALPMVTCSTGELDQGNASLNLMAFPTVMPECNLLLALPDRYN